MLLSIILENPGLFSMLSEKDNNMKECVITVHDFGSFFKEHQKLRLAGVNDYLVFAYNTIFMDNVYTEADIHLKDWQFEKINLLLSAGLKLIKKHLPQDTQLIIECELRGQIPCIMHLDAYVQGAANNYINDLINKSTKQKCLSVAEQDEHDVNTRKRRIEQNFGAKLYKIKAAVVFYYTELLAIALGKNNIELYSLLLQRIMHIYSEIKDNLFRHNGGEKIHSTQKELQKLYRTFYPEYIKYGDECLNSFDWKGYANSDIIKQTFIENVKKHLVTIPESIIESYEIECLCKKI